MPFGKAWLYEENDWAVADFTLNLDTQAGKEWHAALQFDLSNGTPVQEWSYGFRTLKAGRVTRENKQVRELQKLDAFEISPVLRGAGVDDFLAAMRRVERAPTASLPETTTSILVILVRTGAVMEPSPLFL
jgi:phage head maturation protease